MNSTLTPKCENNVFRPHLVIHVQNGVGLNVGHDSIRGTSVLRIEDRDRDAGDDVRLLLGLVATRGVVVIFT